MAALYIGLCPWSSQVLGPLKNQLETSPVNVHFHGLKECF